MKPYTDSREYWMSRAEEAWSIADLMSFGETREVMIKIAKAYEKLAETAEERKALLTITDSFNKQKA